MGYSIPPFLKTCSILLEIVGIISESTFLLQIRATKNESVVFSPLETREGLVVMALERAEYTRRRALLRKTAVLKTFLDAIAETFRG